MDALTWGALFRRAWRVLRQRFTPLAPDCVDCGFPLERVGSFLDVKPQWGDGAGRCAECAQLRTAIAAESQRTKQEAEQRRAAREAMDHAMQRAAYMLEPQPTLAQMRVIEQHAYLDQMTRKVVNSDAAATAFEEAWLKAHPRPRLHPPGKVS